MTETAEKLKLELSQLSAQERAEIALFLIQSLDENVDNDVEAAWDMELTKRLEDIHRETGASRICKFTVMLNEAERSEASREILGFTSLRSE